MTQENNNSTLSPKIVPHFEPINDDYKKILEPEAMKEMECWGVQEHIKNCEKCQEKNNSAFKTKDFKFTFNDDYYSQPFQKPVPSRATWFMLGCIFNWVLALIVFWLILNRTEIFN